jgi:hypothetical protein
MQGYTKGIPIDTDVNLALNSDLLVPSQKAVKTYVDNKVYNFIPNLTYQIQNALTLGTGLVPNLIQSVTTTNTVTQGFTYMYPFVLAMNYLVTKIAVQVTTAGSGSNVYIGVYELDSDFQPLAGAPLIGSTALSCSTTGLKTFTLGTAVQLNAGVRYGLSIMLVGANNVTFRSIYCLNWYGSNGNTVLGIAQQVTSTGLTALPTNFVPSAIVSADRQIAITLFRN